MTRHQIEEVLIGMDSPDVIHLAAYLLQDHPSPAELMESTRWRP